MRWRWPLCLRVNRVLRNLSGKNSRVSVGRRSLTDADNRVGSPGSTVANGDSSTLDVRSRGSRRLLNGQNHNESAGVAEQESRRGRRFPRSTGVEASHIRTRTRALRLEHHATHIAGRLVPRTDIFAWEARRPRRSRRSSAASSRQRMWWCSDERSSNENSH